MKKRNIKPLIAELPEEISSGNIRFYGETTYNNFIALLSHYLNASDEYRMHLNNDEKKEYISLIEDYLQYKGIKENFSEKEIHKVAESPYEYDLFSDFFQVPFPSPHNYQNTVIDLFAGIGGFRIAMQELGGKCVYSSEFDAQAQRTYFANYGDMPFGDKHLRLKTAA